MSDRPSNRENLMSLADQVVWGLRTYIGEIFEHTPDCFPDVSNAGWDIVSHANPNTYSAWTEIIDDGATKLVDQYPDNDIRITGVLFEYSDTNEQWVIEIAYGDAKTIVHKIKWIGNNYPLYIGGWSKSIPAGEIPYYRAMCGVGGSGATIVLYYYRLSE